jgi:hypothetical protein
MSLPLFAQRHRHKIVPLLLLSAVLSSSVIWRHELVAWFTGQSLRRARSTPTVAQSGAVQLAFQLQPDPPQQHGNTVHLQLRDANGAPLEADTVTVAYSMSAVGAMPEMRGEADVTTATAGQYQAAFDLPMGAPGPWRPRSRRRQGGRPHGTVSRWGMLGCTR